MDGSLLPCWSWASHPQLYSGKHKTTGMNVQVPCTLNGDLAWISDPIDGSRHDTYCLRESGVLLTLDPGDWVGDKGYVGNDMITPFKKPADRDLLDWENEFNTQIKDPMGHRTGHRQLQDLANSAHRLPPTGRNIRHDHLNRRGPALLRNSVNNPPGVRDQHRDRRCARTAVVSSCTPGRYTTARPLRSSVRR